MFCITAPFSNRNLARHRRLKMLEINLDFKGKCFL
nr:MAG TPA: hypothetical protein [Caudoviricetes sp.]